MALEDLRDDDWDDILEELRVLVIGSGFGLWDESVIAHIEEEDDLDPRWVLLTYLDEFMEFLSIRSTDKLEGLGKRLGQFITLETGEPLREASLFIEQRRAIEALAGQPAGREIPILSGEPCDALIKELRIFRFALVGEGPPDYFDESEDQS